MRFTTTAPSEEDYVPPYEEGDLIDAVLIEVKRDDYEYPVGSGTMIPKLKWEFQVTEEGPMKGKSIFGESTTNFTQHPNCKAYTWSCRILGRQLEVDENFDTDDVLLMPCKVLVAHQKGKDGRIWLKVGEVHKASVRSAHANTNYEPSEEPF